MASSLQDPFLTHTKEEQDEVHQAQAHEDQTTEKHPTSINEAIEEYVGSFGPGQLAQALLVSIAWCFDAQHTFINIFTDAEPTWHCTSPSGCGGAASVCEIGTDMWAWDRGVWASTVSEWGVSCSSRVIAGLPASAFFFGCLVGGLVLATLADTALGRKRMLHITCLMMSLAGLFTSLSPNIWTYSSLRFISGFARATVCTSALVLSTELVGRRWRGEVGVIGFFCFTIGFLSLPIMAYFFQNSSWRVLYLMISLPTFFYSILVHFFVKESPRWLLVRGREEEALKILRSMARLNGKSIDFNIEALCIEEEAWNVNVYSAMKILWEKKWAFRRLLAIMVVNFGVGLVYYGMPLGAGNLDFNLYLSVTFNALAEFPSALLTFFLISRLNRRCAMITLSMVSGVFSILCVFLSRERKGGLFLSKERMWDVLVSIERKGDIKNGWQMGAEFVAFFSCCTAFNIVIIYCLELFPTSVRNSALSLVRLAIVFAAIFSPLLVVLGRENAFWSFGVFGLVIICCGMFSLLLPETRGRPFCDTMEEQECKEGTSSSPLGA